MGKYLLYCTDDFWPSTTLCAILQDNWCQKFMCECRTWKNVTRLNREVTSFENQWTKFLNSIKAWGKTSGKGGDGLHSPENCTSIPFIHIMGRTMSVSHSALTETTASSSGRPLRHTASSSGRCRTSSHNSPVGKGWSALIPPCTGHDRLSFNC